MALTVSELLRRDIKPFLLGTFLSRTIEKNVNGEKYLECYTSYQKSKYVFDIDFNYAAYVNELKEDLNYFSGYKNWEIDKADGKVKISFTVKNDLNISKVAFVRSLYNKMMREEWVGEPNLNEQKKQFLRGYIETRGSVDTSRKLIAQDYFYDNRFELKMGLQLVTILDLPLEYININFRDLQPQYTSGENMRNTQFRVKAFWYANQIGFLNKYKAKIFKTCYYTRREWTTNRIQYFDVDVPNSRNASTSFINYFNFFTNNIFEKQLTDGVIETLRNQLGFNSTPVSTGHRDQTLRKIFDTIEEDKCAICGTTQTFTNRTTGRQHFEIHHVISYTNGVEFDNIANLVKLCPTCHDSLGKGRAPKDVQIRGIITILTNKPNVFEYVSDYFQTTDIYELSEKIWEMLG